MNETAMDYIEKNFERCVRNITKDKGTLIGLPYPYTVPSMEAFDEIYYWDTYFTNVGLILLGKASLAKNNVDNMLYLVDKFGFMPNGNRTHFLSNSQPPFLSEMVKDIYAHFKDKVWLAGAYFALAKEYKFWMSERISPLCLNRYAPSIIPERIEDCKKYYVKRLGIKEGIDTSDIARHGIAVCESGWDMTPRWDFEAYNFAPIDLNSLMYGFENNMEYFAEILENGDAPIWKQRAGKRIGLMNQYLLNEKNIFSDYNFVSGKFGKVFSTASYYAMFNRVATEKQAEVLVGNLGRLEEEYGVATCEKNELGNNYQWDYPNGWACQQYIVIRALENYGYVKEAKRIAEKYVTLTEKVFEKTHNFWEKYNVAEGNINVSNEYEMPTMLGWSAGIYVYAKEFLKD